MFCHIYFAIPDHGSLSCVVPDVALKRILGHKFHCPLWLPHRSSLQQCVFFRERFLFSLPGTVCHNLDQHNTSTVFSLNAFYNVQSFPIQTCSSTHNLLHCRQTEIHICASTHTCNVLCVEQMFWHIYDTSI